MKDTIDITRQLPIQEEHVRSYAQYFAQQLQTELGIVWSWKTMEVIEFHAPSGSAKGCSGILSMSGSSIRVVVRLPFLLAVMSDGIEKEINSRLDDVERMARGQAAV